MKLFVIASLVAAAMAEADPGYLYGGYGLGYAGLGYGYGGFGYGYGKNAPCVNAFNVPVPCAGKRKREAEAEPGFLGLGYGLGYAGLGYGYGVGVVAGHQNGLPHGVTTTGVHSSLVGVCTNVAGVQVPCKRKREAEAEPGFLGLGYGLGYGYGVGVVAGHQNGLPHGVTTTGVHSSLVGVCTNVAGVQVPCKRKREAEAEPGFLGLGYGLGYAGLGYGYGVGVVAGHQNGLPHGVTTTGVHSSLVGVCTNVLGAQVPC